MTDVWIAGAGLTRFGRRDEKLPDLIAEAALAIREMPYVDAARAAGFGHARFILRHMLPNVIAP
ncbi:MAG TPA: hypothetical protein VMC04_06005, partial [Verrucomicrobiae bacterium]|nr:hypothetical protein [Verrucomicrobiae bacterium]